VWGKVACWSTKAAISLKRVKIEEKLLWRAYRNSPTLFRTVRPPTSLQPRLSPDWGFATLQNLIAFISGTGKATDFKFSWYIQRVYPNKSSFRNLEKRERGPIHGLHNFFQHPLLSQEGVKLRTFICTFIGSIAKKTIKNFLKSSHGRTQGL